MIEIGVGDGSDLRVPLRRVAVELCLAGQAARQAELFLGQRSDRAWHRQAVLDLLEGDRRFLPCRDGDAGMPALINRDHILWVAIPLDEDRSLADDEVADLGELYDERHQVTLRVVGGRALEGSLLYSAPSEQARLVDHLNQDGSFITLYRRDQILLVRKSAVLEVVEDR